jgi:tetratricopeptide (TPR) repeat protein
MPTTVCLNMIVRDESAVIERCLASVRPFIDSWVIVDTGSLDDTPQRVETALVGIPGELHHRPWRDFGHNRNEALDLARAKGNYLLFIDADERLHAPEGFSWPDLAGDAYYLHAEYAGTTYSRGVLVSTRLEWRWTGVIHEYLASTPAAQFTQLEWPRIVVSHDGARARDPKTYEKDAAILERALAAEPQKARYAFYLAQSYRDAGQPEKARDAYRRRAAMSGWDEETWYSLYEIGRLSERLGAPLAEMQGAYLAAYQFRPQRAEPLYQLARFHRERREFALAYLFARQAAAIPRPADLLFVDDDVYRWRSLDELSVAASWVGALSEGRQVIDRLIAEGNVPAPDLPRVEANLRFYLGSSEQGEPKQ